MIVSTEAREPRKVVLLVSGGMDSASLMFLLQSTGWDVVPLFVDYGQVTKPGEWQAVNAITSLAGSSKLEVLSVPAVGHLGSGMLVKNTDRSAQVQEYFPSRNLFLLTLGAMQAVKSLASSVAIGIIDHTSSYFPDCSELFLERAQAVLHVEYPWLTLLAPLIRRSKTEIVSEATGYGLIPELTFSCNRLSDHHCWECSSCQDRMNTLRDIGALSDD